MLNSLPIVIGEKIMHNTSPLKFAQQGVVLLEAMIAILIFSMGVLAIVGLQAAMIKNTADSKSRAEASYIAQQRIGLMWSDPGNLASYLEADTNISTLLPGGTRTVTQPVAGQFTVTVTWQQPGDQAQHNFTTTARITGG
jgi:type IV pilus assembly protein PilV